MVYNSKIIVESMSTRLTTWADERVSDRRILVERMTVCLVSQYQFHVLGGGIKDGIVDIRNKTYSCRVFQLDQLICAHAIAACLTIRVDYISLCFKFYTKESLVMTYAQPVKPRRFAWCRMKFLAMHPGNTPTTLTTSTTTTTTTTTTTYNNNTQQQHATIT